MPEVLNIYRTGVVVPFFSIREESPLSSLDTTSPFSV